MTDLNTLLAEERDKLREENRELTERITTASKRFEDIQKRLRHVEGLLEVEESPSKTNGQIITDIAYEILGERNGLPMHYGELVPLVQERGGKLSGKNAANILATRLSADERFVRPFRRGCYARQVDYPDKESVGARKKPQNGDTTIQQT